MFFINLWNCDTILKNISFFWVKYSGLWQMLLNLSCCRHIPVLLSVFLVMFKAYSSVIVIFYGFQQIIIFYIGTDNCDNLTIGRKLYSSEWDLFDNSATDISPNTRSVIFLHLPSPPLLCLTLKTVFTSTSTAMGTMERVL